MESQDTKQLQAKRSEDVEHDMHLLKTKGVFAQGFRLFGKGLFGKPQPGPKKKGNQRLSKLC